LGQIIRLRLAESSSIFPNLCHLRPITLPFANKSTLRSVPMTPRDMAGWLDRARRLIAVR
jgi:hypothetical protein